MPGNVEVGDINVRAVGQTFVIRQIGFGGEGDDIAT
jgi:hypothetical protein